MKFNINSRTPKSRFSFALALSLSTLAFSQIACFPHAHVTNENAPILAAAPGGNPNPHLPPPPSIPDTTSPVRSLNGVDLGDGCMYCRLTVDVPEIGLRQPQAPLEQDRHLGETLEHEHKLQEAIWIYLRHEETKPQADRLKRALRHILQAGRYEDVHHQLGGSTRKKVLRFDNNIRGIFKFASRLENEAHMLQIDAKAEIAAYELDELLEIGIVPMTVMRHIHEEAGVPAGESGSLQYMVSAEESTAHQLDANGVRRMKVLDFLSGNIDRKSENWLWWALGNLVVGIDNGYGFKQFTCGDPHETARILELEPNLKDRILHLSEREFRTVLDPWVAPEFLELVIGRLHQLKTEIGIVDSQHHSVSHHSAPHSH